MKTGKEAARSIEVFKFIPSVPPEGWQPEMGTFGWNGAELYIPSRAAGLTEMEALFLCGRDGDETVGIVENVVIIPESWARKNRPERKAVYDAIRKRALEIIAEQTKQFQSS